ncbi:hypothetical protein D3C76_1333370 [compost metagenome]
MSRQNQALFVLGSSSKTAFFMSKKFTFHELSWNCSTVNRNKWTFAAVTQTVNKISNNFFTCTRFPRNKHRSLGTSYFFYSNTQVLYRWRTSD